MGRRLRKFMKENVVLRILVIIVVAAVVLTVWYRVLLWLDVSVPHVDEFSISEGYMWM